MKNLSKHIPHYLSLGAVLLAGILAFLFFSYERVFQVAVAIAVAVSYVAWGIIHHAIHDDLYLTVVVEYIMVAAIGLFIVFSLIFRA